MLIILLLFDERFFLINIGERGEGRRSEREGGERMHALFVSSHHLFIERSTHIIINPPRLLACRCLSLVLVLKRPVGFCLVSLVCLHIS